MKDLKVNYWQERKHWVIDARRVGLNVRQGNFSTKSAALKEAELLKAKFLTGAIAEKVDVVKVSDAADTFIKFQETRKDDKEVSLSFYKDFLRSFQITLAIKIDGKSFKNHDLSIMKQENKDEISKALLRGIHAEGKSKATAEKRIKFLKMFLNYCVRKGWASINVMDKVTLGMSSTISDRAPRIQPETIQKIVSKGLASESLFDRCMVITALATGVRQGELRALNWSNIDFQNNLINVEGAVKHGTLKIGAPKTKRGKRSIPVDQVTMNQLKQLRLQSRFSSDYDLVFASANGTPKMQKMLDKLIRRVCEAAGVDRILWGDMRHFYASVQLSSLGEDWSTVAALMGHGTPDFTYRQYGHYVKNDAKQDKARSAAAQAMYGGV